MGRGEEGEEKNAPSRKEAKKVALAAALIEKQRKPLMMGLVRFWRAKTGVANAIMSYERKEALVGGGGSLCYFGGGERK